MIVEFKDTSVLRACFKNAWHPKLIEVLIWIGENFNGAMAIITEGWRMAHAGDVHCTNPLRAFDMRSWVFKNPELVETKINEAWEYDPQRPDKQVAWYHEASEGSGYHLHIQVHPRTQRRTM